MSIDHDSWKLGLSEPDITFSREEAEQVKMSLERLEAILWLPRGGSPMVRKRQMPEECRDLLLECVAGLERLLGIE